MFTLDVPGTGLFEDKDWDLLARCGIIVISSLILKGLTWAEASGRLPFNTHYTKTKTIGLAGNDEQVQSSKQLGM